MKTRKSFAGFAIATLLALGSIIGLAGTAHAEDDYTCIEGGNPPPADGLDGVNIIQNGTSPDVCTLGNIHVKHFLGIGSFKTISTGSLASDDNEVVIQGGPASNVTTGAVSAGTNIRIGGAVNVGSLTAGTTGAGNVSLSGGNAGLASGAISNTNGWIYITSPFTMRIASITNTNGDVRVFANYQQTSGAVQNIGPGGIGSIVINSGSGNGIYVSNPYDIDYNGGNILQPNIASNAGGYVILDTGHWTDGVPDGTNSGVVTLKGSINVDDPTAAGFIDIFALQIVAKGATLSASSPSGQVGTINLVTNALTDRSGLAIYVDGNNDSQTIDLSIFPIGSYGIVSASTIQLPIFFTDYATSTQPLTINGNGDFTINANGNNNAIKIFGYPLKIQPLSTTINNKGSGNLVTIQGTDGGDQLNTLKWGGSVQIHANNTANGQTANLIEVKATEIANLTDNVVLDASGGAGTANGSNISLTTTTGNLSIGGPGGTELLNADAGQTGGNAGRIDITNSGGNISILNGSKVSASVPIDVSRSGDGGLISVTSGSPSVNGKITVKGTVQADSGFAGGAGKSLILGYSLLGTGDGVVISGNGTVSNNGSDNGLAGGNIIFKNQVSSAALSVRIDNFGFVSAINGTVRFLQPDGNVSIAGTSTAESGPIKGGIVATGKNVDIKFPVAGVGSEFRLENINASSGDVVVNVPGSSVAIIPSGPDSTVQAAQKVNLTATTVEIGLLNATPGQVSVKGGIVTIKALIDGITLGTDVRAHNEITLTAENSGRIKSIGGKVGSVTGGETTRLSISTEQGSIGDNPFVPFSKPLLTEVSSLVVSTPSNSSTTVNISNSTSNQNGLRVDDLSLGGSFQLASNGSIRIGTITVANGSIDITAGTGELRVRSGASLLATEGNIGLANSDTTLGTIVIAPAVTMKATTVTTERNFRGNVAIYLGSVLPIFGHNHSNPNVAVFGDTTLVDFGDVGITALNDPSTINVFQRLVQFYAGTRREAIKLLGNDSITAQGN